jgi:hypothetical protein
MFSLKVRKEPKVDSALVLTWIELDKEQTYSIYSTQPERRKDILLPSWFATKFSQVSANSSSSKFNTISR